MSSKRPEFAVPADAAGQTLRVFLGDALPLEPEDFVRTLIESGNVTVSSETSDPKRVLQAGDVVAVADLDKARSEFKSETIRAPVIYEDEDLLILNKPAGCTVVRERHSEICPFQNGVLEHLRRSPYAARIAGSRYRPRAVHRLDRDTTGAVMFAKTRAGELHLFRQFQERLVKKEYLAVVHGEVADDSGVIEAAVASEPDDLERMSIDERTGKASQTDYAVVERFRGFTLVRAQPRTGRRHQVRIHLSHIGHPIVADRIYGGGNNLMLSTIKRRYRFREGQEEKPVIARPALHAAALTFLSVGAATPTRVEALPPRDFEVLLKMLRKYAAGGSRTKGAPTYEADDY